MDPIYFPTVRQWKLDSDGRIIPDGFDPNDDTLTVMPDLRCRVCFSRVENVLDYKTGHIRWHQTLALVTVTTARA